MTVVERPRRTIWELERKLRSALIKMLAKARLYSRDHGNLDLMGITEVPEPLEAPQ